MKILITGGCGFIGSNLAIFLKKKKHIIYYLDNLYRKGSLNNLSRLKRFKIKNYKYNISNMKYINKLPKFDLIIDCCAEPSVNASKFEMDRVFKTNLIGTYNILEKCFTDKTNIIFLSSSRVYALDYLKKININHRSKYTKRNAIKVSAPTENAKSLYGFTKLASEQLIKEFAYIRDIKFVINRLGVVAGPWQYGKVDQGFFSLWVWKHFTKGTITYKGYGGNGNQIRDVLHVDDLCELIELQIENLKNIYNETFNVGGGVSNSISLKELSFICEKITGNKIKFKKEYDTSIYDVPYYVSSNKKIKKTYNWFPKKKIKKIAEDIYIWQNKNFKKIKSIFN